MARTTPAQKPRGWASITFIKTSRFDTGLRSVLAFGSAFSRTCGQPPQGGRGQAYLRLFMSRRARAVALLTHSFQVFISFWPKRSAVLRNVPDHRLLKPRAKARAVKPKFKPHLGAKMPGLV